MRHEILHTILGLGLDVAGVAFALMCLWGIIGFAPSPRQLAGQTSAAVWLALAITLGFATNGLSALIMFLIEPLIGDRTNATMAVHIMLRVAATLAVYLHFVARHKALSIDEQEHWTPLLMPFYPDRGHLLYRVFFRNFK